MNIADEDTFEYQDEDGVWHDSPQAYLWTKVLGGCGCGRGDELEERAWEVLKHFANAYELRQTDLVYGDLTNETIAHWMDSKGLIDHGTSISGSWLTDKGEKLYKYLTEWKPEPVA